MTPEHRKDFGARVAAAKAGDKKAIRFLRRLAIGLCAGSPPTTLIRFVEAFNDLYTDEQIAWAETVSNKRDL